MLVESLLKHTFDLMVDRFGLPPSLYDSLARDVDLVLHDGALVNHAFSYRQLFGPNVMGAVRVMQLAAAHRLKRVAFVSSLRGRLGLRGITVLLREIGRGCVWIRKRERARVQWLVGLRE